MRSEYDRDGLMKAQLVEQLNDVDNFQKKCLNFAYGYQKKSQFFWLQQNHY